MAGHGEATAARFDAAGAGAPGSRAWLVLSNPACPGAAPRRVALRRGRAGVAPAERFAQRRARLARALVAECEDGECFTRLGNATALLDRPAGATPVVALLAARAADSAALLGALLGALNPSDALLSPSPLAAAAAAAAGGGGATPLAVAVGACVRRLPREAQPLALVEAAPLAGDPDARAVRRILAGRWGAAPDTHATARGADGGVAVDCVVVAANERAPPDAALLAAVRRACGDLGVPVLAALLCAPAAEGAAEGAAEDAAAAAAAAAAVARGLPRASLFPVAAGAAGAKAMPQAAALELLGRARTLGARHALFAQEEATWANAADICM